MKQSPMTDPDHFDLRSHDAAGDKIAELLRLFPEIRTEGGKLDVDRLKLALGENVDIGKERYGMNWPGKAECFKTIQAPSLGTLRPCPEESVNFETTENLIIEGDNLEVLKLLQKSYLGKVKMIYIDPPYNTGNDFIYPDNYSESLQTYLEYTRQVDDSGRRFGTNTEADGRFHSKWLNMMYPRLYLARNLLCEDGVVFVSIGEQELHNLRAVMNDLFGEDNYISTISRMMKSGGAKGNFFTPNIDFIMVYARHKDTAARFRAPRTQDQIDVYYNKTESEGPRKGQLYGEERLFKASLDPRPNQRYWIQCPNGELVIPPGKIFPDVLAHGEKILPGKEDKVWKWTFSRYADEFKQGNIVFKQTDTSALVTPTGKQAKWNIYNKVWLEEQEAKGMVPGNFIEEFENRQSASELKQIGIPFDFAKPSNLIKYLVTLARVSGNDIVLDFFAGSCSTAHAAVAFNKSEGANCRFIMVQLPEPCEEGSEAWESGFRTISDIGKERVRRVIKSFNEEDAGELDMDDGRTKDRGFRVFKLAESNFTTWDAQVAHEPKALQNQLDFHVDHIREARTADDILYELLLKSGFPLTTPVEKLTLAGKTVHSVASGALMICLERELTLELIRAIADAKPERVVCLDEGFAGNDQLKANAVQTFKTKGIVKFQTV
jgi:adenine-specific DNA-methyltransferase